MTDDTKKDALELKPKRIRNIASARRLLATLIYEFQKGNVTDSKAKTIAYLLIKYSELFKVEKIEDIEKRIENLEKYSL